MSIRYKLLLTMIALSAVAVAVSSWLGYRNGKKNLEQAVIRQLTAVRRDRTYQIETYFRIVRNHVLTLSDDRMFIEAMKEFGDAYAELGRGSISAPRRDAVLAYYEKAFLPDLKKLMPLREAPESYLPVTAAAFDLQDSYIVHNPNPPGQKKRLNAANDGTKYSRVHARYHPAFRKLVDQFGYYDLLLIEPEKLAVVYSVAKEPVFGTSLALGPYRNTTLAKFASKALHAANRDAVFISDYEFYEPSRGKPAAFVLSPIWNENSCVGVFAMQLSIGQIDRVVSRNRGWERDGLGRTGDVGVIGSDYLMRSTARGFLENRERALTEMRARGIPEEKIRRMIAYDTTILQLEVRLPSVQLALAGKEGTMSQTSSSGKATLVSYMPLNVPGLHWSVGARIELAEALAPLEPFRRMAIIWASIALLLTAIVALLMTNAMLKPINALVSAARRMRSGDLTARVPVTAHDELGMLSTTFNDMAAEIQSKIKIIEQKNRENEELLLNILPGPIAERLKSGDTAIADSFAQVTVLFSDMVGFTKFSSTRSPAEIVRFLNGMFTRFDQVALKHGIEKIKTIGDAYMAVGGLPKPWPDHAQRIAELALDMLTIVEDYGKELGVPLSIRIGMNSGPVVAGVVGTMKYIYDLWGDTVNLASRMESTGVPGAIQVTRSVYEQLKDQYVFERRGDVEVKGKGEIETWLLRSRARSHPHLTASGSIITEPRP